MKMSNAVYSVDEIKYRLFPVFEHYGVEKAVLFGSYGKGQARPESDIDLLVDSGLKGLKFIGFMEAVRDKIDKDVDVFDISHIEIGSMIDKEIKDTGVLIYEK